MKTKLPLIAMFLGMVAFAQNPGDLIVSEIMIDPNGTEREQEWFEVYNTTSTAIDMNGWIINDESSSGRAHVITSAVPVMVPANGYAVLVANDDPLLNGGITNSIYEYGYDSPIGGPATPGAGTNFPTWNNESTYANGSTNDDGIRLETATGTVIDQILYGFGYAGLNAWPAMGAASDVSYQLDAATLDSASNDVAANWLPSTAIYGTDMMVGTPGTANSNSGGTPALGAGDIVITELMIDPNGSEDEREYFEVYNTTAAAIDLMGWTIVDASSSGRAHEITTSTVVPANSYAVLAASGDATLNGGIPAVAYEYGFDSPPGGTATPGVGSNFPRFNNESSFDDGTPNDNEIDGIALLSASGTEIDRVEYDYGYGTAPIGFPMMMFSGGGSIESNTFDVNANDLAAAWTAATATFGTASQLGTPGIQNTLSVSSNELGAVKLYPNPATNFLSIELEDENWNSLTIYSLTGQQLISVKEYTSRVDVSNLNTGTYFVKVNANQGSETIQFLVK
ncbi:hypothetical protein JCM19314_1874 [Nonlabens ulvanivorans]|uniref:LTD domain-containing protein n=1 Tax=Nonlabens ulvanivorans TaxID=906888 RepID=A0A090QFJ9_NONUL|nr:lamin tail domain-containing protein [Nonlabens ulvanivorans]GAL01721.1 hypothetical protein JCM19314_1874 [Nonlabens ulvanivorans]